MIHIEIIEVLQEYRNGNKDILNTLYSDKVKYKNNSGFKFYDRSQFVILDNGIRSISNKTYNIFKQSGINEKAGKYTESTYCGNENDFAKETIMVLINLFNDKSFVPATSKEVYGQLKYNLKKYLNNSLNSVCSISDVFTNYEDDDNEECSYYDFISQMPDFDFSEKHEGYIGEIKELMDILKTYDIMDFCSPNATAQKANTFKEALGYTKNNYKSLIKNINDHFDADKLEERGDNGYGMRYQQIMKLKGPNNKEANVLTAWIEDDSSLKLTSVYVTKKEESK